MQVIGHGSTLGLDTTAGGTGINADTFTNIKGFVMVDFGSNKIDVIENTDMGSPGTQRSFIPGLEDPGDASIKINVIPTDATQAAFRATKGDGQIHYFKATFPPAVSASVSFAGFITNIDMTLDGDKLPVWSAKIKMIGIPVYSGC